MGHSAIAAGCLNLSNESTDDHELGRGLVPMPSVHEKKLYHNYRNATGLSACCNCSMHGSDHEQVWKLESTVNISV